MSPMHPLVALAPTLFMSPFSCPFCCPLTGRSTCQTPPRQTSSQYQVPALPHFCTFQLILPFEPSYSRFPLPLSQSITVPWAVTGGFCMLRVLLLTHWEKDGPPAFLLPPQGCLWLQSPIPHPCCARQIRVIAQTGHELVLCLWGALLIAAVPPWLLQQHQQGRHLAELLLCSVHGAGHGPPPCRPAENRDGFPTALYAAQGSGERELTRSNLGTES